MSVELRLDVEGLETLREKLHRLDNCIKRKVGEAMLFEAEAMRNAARARCPVRTGRLRDSIYAKVQDWIIKLGATAPYAVFQEFGTRYIRPKEFLRNAVHLRLQSLINRINHAISDAAGEAKH